MTSLNPRLHIETPFVESLPLSLLVDGHIMLKMESAQPSGSFKLRGMGYACRRYLEQGARRFIASSGGNAGLAVAYVGRHLGIPVHVILPETTGEAARARIQLEGATIEVIGRTWREAHLAAQASLRPGDAYLHPFDDPLLWEGHATLIDEIAATGWRPHAVVVAVGGGGLLCGVMQGLERAGWHDVQLFAVETVGTASYAAALQAGRVVRLSQVSGIATSLATDSVCEASLAWAQRRAITSVIVTDEEAQGAARRFLLDHRVAVEPACGAALALPYLRPRILHGIGKTLIVVCGGVNVIP